MKNFKIDEHGNMEWFNDKGDWHRDNDLAAVIWHDGDRYWYQNGKFHRLNGPAVDFIDGHKEWYQNGVLHRINGPAIEYADGSKEWWIEGMLYTEEEFNEKVKEIT